ncbi:MAG: hypothetical protein A2161_17400 [Candidatus Schekmanbacteria bacterium RBG_13_48_7]|uniref:Outer membrane protein beta-barrel domain-containing protein n=1 Tax=Candidatus Schekmanbacteria bacterium RBG_13_48_7 TaxID=1817878 RepID=A0A1F7RYN3_9BACT|nr:MAG: hypothetical protein A2161_17400 [Candidatus Schekmanbacteria bacterium RBG_13_48_7]
MKFKYGFILSHILVFVLFFPVFSQAKSVGDEFGVSMGLTRINNSGYGDVYGPMNLSFGAKYEIFFADRRRLGAEIGFRLNYDKGETTKLGNSASFLTLPIYVGLKFRYVSESKWYPYFGAGIQQLYFSESVDQEGFADESGSKTGYYFQTGLHRKWGRAKSTFYEFRYSSTSLDGNSSGTGGKSPNTGAVDFIFGISFSVR